VATPNLAHVRIKSSTWLSLLAKVSKVVNTLTSHFPTVTCITFIYPSALPLAFPLEEHNKLIARVRAHGVELVFAASN
jgi:hypothetical protein